MVNGELGRGVLVTCIQLPLYSKVYNLLTALSGLDTDRLVL